jgi:hypothetical protein
LAPQLRTLELWYEREPGREDETVTQVDGFLGQCNQLRHLTLPASEVLSAGRVVSLRSITLRAFNITDVEGLLAFLLSDLHRSQTLDRLVLEFEARPTHLMNGDGMQQWLVPMLRIMSHCRQRRIELLLELE